MRKSILLFGILVMMSSCKKETTYTLRIGIDNVTTDELQVKVFPKSEFVNGDMYKASSWDDFSDMEFTLHPNGYENLFESTKLDYEPQILLAEIFDSLTIEISIDTVLIIKFKPDSVENYGSNMFSENSTWTYELLQGSERTNLSSHPFEISDYKFEINQDDIIR